MSGEDRTRTRELAGPERNRFSPVLSTQRPWSRGFAWLPPGAPRAVPERPLPPGTAARYPYNGMGLVQRVFEEIRVRWLGKL